MPSLYRRLLPGQFDGLPAALRGFHDVEGERRFQAVFRITRGKGWMRRLMCKLAGLPPAGESVPMLLRVIQEGNRERWERDFNGHRMTSVQWESAGLMVEALGPWRLGFKLHAEGPVLRLELRKVWFLGLRWPLWLGPRVEGVERGTDGGCAIVIRASAPLVGFLIQYEGLVTPAGGEKPVESLSASPQPLARFPSGTFSPLRCIHLGSNHGPG